MSQNANDHSYVQIKVATTLTSLAVIGILVGGILALALSKGTILPISDEARLGLVADRLHAGSLTFRDLWSPNNEHRILLSKVIGASIIYFTEWNRMAHLLVALTMVAVSAALFLRAVWLTIPWKPAALACIPIFLALSFSLTRYGNWGIPYTDKIPTVLGVAISTWALAHPRRIPHFVLAVIGATLASVSSLGGFIVWIAFFPVVLASWGRRFVVWWGLSAIALAGIYLIAYKPQTGNPLNDAPPLSLTGRAMSLLAYLGAPIGGERFVVSVAFGLLGLILAGAVIGTLFLVVRADRSHLHPALLWSGIAVFAIGAGLAIVLGRSSAFGASVATESRFHAFSSLWWFALTALSALLVAIHALGLPGQLQVSGNFRNAVSGVGISLLIVVSAGFVNANTIAAQSAAAFLDYYRQSEGCALNPAQASVPCLRIFMYSEPEVERDTLMQLQANRQGVYANPVTVVAAGAPAPLPPSEPGTEVSVFSCSKDARRQPSNDFPDAVISAACQRAAGSWWPEQPLTLDPLGSRNLCLVSEWDRWGKRLVIDSKPWCAIEWFEPDLQAVSLVGLDKAAVLHAYPDGTIHPYLDGVPVRREKSRR